MLGRRNVLLEELRYRLACAVPGLDPLCLKVWDLLNEELPLAEERADVLERMAVAASDRHLERSREASACPA